MRATKWRSLPTSQLSKRSVHPSPCAIHSMRRDMRFSCASSCTWSSHLRESSSLGTIWKDRRYCVSSDMFTAARTAIPRCVCSESSNLGSSEWRMQISRIMEPLNRLRRYVGVSVSQSSRSRCDVVPVIDMRIRAVMRCASSGSMLAPLGSGKLMQLSASRWRSTPRAACARRLNS